MSALLDFALSGFLWVTVSLGKAQGSKDSPQSQQMRFEFECCIQMLLNLWDMHETFSKMRKCLGLEQGHEVGELDTWVAGTLISAPIFRSRTFYLQSQPAGSHWPRAKVNPGKAKTSPRTCQLSCHFCGLHLFSKKRWLMGILEHKV